MLKSVEVLKAREKLMFNYLLYVLLVLSLFCKKMFWFVSQK